MRQPLNQNHINGPLISLVLMFSVCLPFLSKAVYAQKDVENTIQFDNSDLAPDLLQTPKHVVKTGIPGIRTLSGRLLLDRYVEVTQGFQADKYIEFIGISTPTASVTSNHAELWLNNTAKQLCTRFDDGSSGCLTTGGSLSGYLTASSATATYLQLSSASLTYLSILTAANTYLTASSAPLTYLQLSSATATYLQSSSATATYGQLKATQTWTGGNVFNSSVTLTNVTSTLLATNSAGLIISTTVSSSGGVSAGSTTTWTGFNTFTSSVAIKGTATNDSALTGYVGEVISTSIVRASAVSAAGNGTYTNIASMTLTAGDWDMSATSCGLIGTATGETFRIGLIGTAGGDNTTGTTEGQDLFYQGPTNTSAGDDCITITSYQISLAANQTYILKGYAAYTGGTPKFFGYMRARRRR